MGAQTVKLPTDLIRLAQAAADQERMTLDAYVELVLRRQVSVVKKKRLQMNRSVEYSRRVDGIMSAPPFWSGRR